MNALLENSFFNEPRHSRHENALPLTNHTPAVARASCSASVKGRGMAGDEVAVAGVTATSAAGTACGAAAGGATKGTGAAGSSGAGAATASSSSAS